MDMEKFMVDIMLPVTYLLFGLTILAVVFGWVRSATSDPKAIIKSLISFAGIAVIFFIGYALATGQEHIIKSGADTTTVSADTSKWIGGALITFYVLLGAAVVGIVFSEISKFFK